MRRSRTGRWPLIGIGTASPAVPAYPVLPGRFARTRIVTGSLIPSVRSRPRRVVYAAPVLSVAGRRVVSRRPPAVLSGREAA